MKLLSLEFKVFRLNINVEMVLKDIKVVNWSERLGSN